MAATAILSGITAVTGLTSGGLSFESARKASKERTKALQLRLTQIEDQSRQEEIQKMRKLNNTLASQAAIQAAKGGGTIGPVTSNMLTLSDLNEFSQDEDADNLSEIFKKESVNSQIIQAQKEGEASETSAIIGGLGSTLQSAANLYVPSVPKMQQGITGANAATGISSEVNKIESQTNGLQLPKFNLPEI